eukprot:2869747-Prymnesium_polylepis.1
MQLYDLEFTVPSCLPNACMKSAKSPAGTFCEVGLGTLGVVLCGQTRRGSRERKGRGGLRFAVGEAPTAPS